MKAVTPFAQLIARLALGIGFLLPIADRLGLIAPAGSPDVAWGDWSHFVAYTQSLMPFLSLRAAHFAGLAATLAECLLGVCLIVGLKVKWMGLGTAIITLTFALCMIFSLGLAAPFKYPVFVFTAAGLLLYNLDTFQWSIDALMKKYITSKQSL